MATHTYRTLQFGQRGLIGDVIAGIHSGGDVISWEDRRDVIVYGSAQFGSGMHYLRENGIHHGERVFVSMPLENVRGYPKVFDWNRDGIPDLVTWDGELRFWENLGGTTTPEFRDAGVVAISQDARAQLPGSISQVEFVQVAGETFVLVGCDDWSDYWPGAGSAWNNQPNPSLGLGKSYDASGNWRGGELRASVWMLRLCRDVSQLYLTEPRVLITVEGDLVGVMGTAAPAVVDLDQDGVWDIILGDFGDGLTYFHNVGSDEEPRFLPGIRLHTPDGELRLHHNLSRPRAVDWSGNGNVDLLVGQENGRLYLLRFLELRADGTPIYSNPFPIQQREPELSVGSAAVPVVCDWDGDGDEDLIVGDAGGDVHLFENIGVPGEPRFALPVKLHAGSEPIRILAGPTGSIQGPAEAKYGYTCPTVADWNGNGLPDLLLSDVTGYHTLYLNIGHRNVPELAPGQRLMLGGRPLQTVWRVRPCAVDWDGDGLVEYLTLDDAGQLTLYRQVPEQGIASLAKWMLLCYEDGTSIKLDGPAGHEGRTKLHVTDWNGNGVWDVLFGIKGNQPLAAGINEAYLFWLENLGSNQLPRFRSPAMLQDNAGNPLAFGGHAATPITSKLYGTQNPILLVGAEDGRIYWFRSDDILP